MKTGDEFVINGKTYFIKLVDSVSCNGCSFLEEDGSCQMYNTEYDDICSDNDAIFIEKPSARDISAEELINEIKLRGFKGVITKEEVTTKTYEL